MIVDRVDRERIARAARQLEHDEIGWLASLVAEPEHFAERDHRQAGAADEDDGGTTELAHPHRLAADADDFVDRRAGNGEMLVAAADRQRGDDRQGERHAQGEAKPLPDLAVDIDEATDPLDVGTHHVHADAAAGDRGDLLRGR